MTWYIYALTDPRSKEIRYVGWTVNIKRRVYKHCRDARLGGNTHRDAWLRSLAIAGFSPLCDVLHSGIGTGWAESERYWIQQLRDMGCRLTNHAAGGEGAPGYHKVLSPETRRKMSESHSRPEARAAKSRAMRGRNLTDSHKQKLRENAGRRSSEYYAALKLANVGRKDSAERTEKTAVKLRGRRRPADVCRRIAEAQRGRKMSAEAIEKSAAGRRGGKRSDETRAKMRAAALRRWEGR